MLSVIYVLITILLSGSYVLLISYILHHWSENPDYSIPDYSISDNASNLLHLSIIIPARNEEKNIAACISSILENMDASPHKPELIIVNDHSDDDTVRIIQSFHDSRIKLLHLSEYIKGKPANAYKKLALAYALSEAQGDYIIQLDADVVLPEDYMSTVTRAILNTDADFIACPVLFLPEGGSFGHFQSLDMMGMMAVTAAGIHSQNWYMANGANMVYKKSLVSYDEDSIASGDDIYTIQKIADDPDTKVLFLKNKEATVSTSVEPNVKSFIRQRLRWGTKNKMMKYPKMQLMMVIPFLNVLWLPVHLIFFVLVGPIAISIGLFHLLVKIGIDYIYLNEVTSFFRMKASMRSFLPSSLMHIIYLLCIGIASLMIKRYNWKGRRVS